MKLYDTLTKTKVEITPLQPGKIRMYTCGPTVYDHAHIGNLRSYLFADTLRRVLESEDLDVTQVMNFTDVDDKTIARSRDQHPDDEPKLALTKLTRQYEARFIEDITRLGIDPGKLELRRATEFMPQMQQLIQEIYDAGCAYIREDGIYFSIAKYQEKGRHAYGELVGHIATATAQHRIDNDEYDKEEASDFALWKAAKPGEPSWELTIDDQLIVGRPGWHIECSAIATHELGQPFDLHTGGIDLIFPHHTNEIAQSTAAANKPLATVFAHNEHLLVGGRRMGKRYQNFYTLKDLEEHGTNPLAFRLLILQAHYRTQQNFTWEALQAADNLLTNLHAWADLQHQAIDVPYVNPVNGEAFADTLVAGLLKFHEAINDDLNTPKALAVVSQMIDDTPLVPFSDLQHFTTTLERLDAVLGLGLVNRPDITEDEKRMIQARETARENGDFQMADKARENLRTSGLEIDDTPHGPRWRRTA